MNFWRSGNVLFLILLAVALFAALSYAVTKATGGGVIDIEKEESEMEIAKTENFESAVNAALWRLKLANGCRDDAISYETPEGDYENPLSPVDYRCHVFHPEGGGVPYTGFVPAGAIDNDPDSFAGNFNDLNGETSGTVVTSNTVTISGINVFEGVTVTGGGDPEYSINGGLFMSSGGQVKDGDTLVVRATAPADGQTNNITITIGEQSDVWSIASQTTGSWTVGSWGSCSASCGGGTQSRSVTCDYDVCTGTEPASSQPCNTHSCCHPDTGNSCTASSYEEEFLACVPHPSSDNCPAGWTNARQTQNCGPNSWDCFRRTHTPYPGTIQCDGSCQ